MSPIIKNQLKCDFINSGKALYDKGVVFFTKKNALSFVRECLLNQYIILGIDGFFIEDDKAIRPSMKHSKNFSQELFTVKGTCSAAKNFLETQDNNLYFDIVCKPTSTESGFNA